MRLKNLKLSGFRSFAREASVDLDASVVILAGPNGTGKTSVLDAIHWALLGRLARVESDPTAIISAYSPDGTARVQLSIAQDVGQGYAIERAFDGQYETLSVTSGEQRWVKSDAERKLEEILWSALELESYDPIELESIFTRSIYLQQDVVTAFIEDDDKARFQAISALVGSSHLADLQSKLESARNAWSRSQTKRAGQIEEAEATFRQLSERVHKLPDSDPYTPQIQQTWASFFRNLSDEGISPSIASDSDIHSPTARRAAEEAVKELRAHRREVDSRITELEEIQLSLGGDDEQPETDSPLAHLNELETVLNENQNLYDLEAKRIEDEQKRLSDLKSAADQLAAMARLALSHLGDNCPVCTQSIDQDKTISHLEELIARAETSTDHLDTSTLDELSEKVRTMEREVRQARSQLEEANEAEERRKRRLERASERASELGLETQEAQVRSDLIKLLQGETRRFQDLRNRISELLEIGESLLVEATRMSEYSQRAEAEKACDQAEIHLGRLLETQSHYAKTYQVATQIIEALRDATTEATRVQINSIEPRLSKIYWRINPHPVFTSVRFDTFMSNKKGHSKVLVTDPNRSEAADQEPRLIFSTSQMNALAVSAFLAFNLQRKRLPLDLAILDDPLQSLDDVNLLGLVDVLRRVKSNRQLLLTTHDARFQKLLSRKLRPTRVGERQVTVAFSDWNRDGPTFETVHTVGRAATQSVVTAA